MSGYLNVQYPEGLSGIFGGQVMGEQTDNARRNQATNQQMALQDMLFNEQMNPLKLKKAEAELDSTVAGTENSRELTRGRKLDNDFQAATQSDAIKAKISELAKQASDDDIKMLQNAAQKMMWSGDPRQVELGKTFFKLHGDLIKEKEKAGYQLEKAEAIENLRTKRATMLQGMKAEAQSRILAAKGSAEKSNDPNTLRAVAARLTNEALRERDPERRALLQEQANLALQTAFDFEQRLRSTPRPLDPNDPTRAITGNTTPIVNPPAPQLTPQGPGVPRLQPVVKPNAASGDRVRVQSPDGKVGSVPRAQLQEALKQGYREVK